MQTAPNSCSWTSNLASLWGYGNVVELAELAFSPDVPTNAGDTSQQLVLAGPVLPELSVKEWHRCFLAPLGVFNSGALDLHSAQATEVVHARGVLTSVQVEAIHRLAERAAESGAGREIRSAPVSDSWDVTFLQTGGFFELEAPDLAAKLAALARSVGDRAGWTRDADDLHIRVAEYHKQVSPCHCLPDTRHYDADSLVTIDLMLSIPGSDFAGGEFRTLEEGGLLREHTFGQGDALVFASHKFHSVAPVTHGRRRVLVLELWQGPARRCPHRCRSLHARCPQEVPPVVSSEGGAVDGRGALPFRIGAVSEREPAGPGLPRQVRVFWQAAATCSEAET